MIKNLFTSIMTIFGVLLIIGTPTYVIYDLIKKHRNSELKYYNIIEIMDCTNATSDVWKGRIEGTCAVKLSNGTIKTITRPVYLGQSVSVVVYFK